MYIYIYIFIYIYIYIHMTSKISAVTLNLLCPRVLAVLIGVHRDLEEVLGLATFPFEVFMVWL